MPEVKADKSGYLGRSSKILSENGIEVGDSISIETRDGMLSGILLPRYESADQDHIVIKLKSGYNTGIQVSEIKSIKKLSSLQDQKPKESQSQQQQQPAKSESLPKVALISTGGTIASKIDYRTGGVRAALSADDLYASVPELARYASIDPEVLISEYSENLNPGHWTLIAKKIAEKVNSGMYRGIIISHGTDTMHYTAAALSFALKNLPIPVVLVGAQRSSDRPSSDAALNLIGATIFAIKSEYAGVFVAMHTGLSDDIIACHVGTRVRKNHTSRRDAFESIDSTPFAITKAENIELQNNYFTLAKRRNQVAGFVCEPEFDEKVLLLKYYPGMNPSIIDHAVNDGFHAIIIEGTGLGHISRQSFPNIKKAVEKGILVCMTSQCIWGRVRMTVYDTGRDLLDLGVVPLSDMIPEAALAKAMWALANSIDADATRKIMQEKIANEISESIPITDKE